jgi:hypothetical protein
MRFFYILFIFLLLEVKPGFSKALDNQGMVPLLSLAIGSYNVQRDKRTAQFQLEYKFDKAFFMARPMIGAFMTSKSAFYLYAGIGWDLHFSKYIVVTPSFAPGIYFQGNDKNLGYPLEFRTCLEAAYKFKNKARLGAQFYHLSNASLSNRNPGEESLLLFYSFPLN